MKTRITLLLISAILLTRCNNFIHDLIPREDDQPTPPVILTVTFDKNSGDTDASPTIKTVSPPGATIDALPAVNPTWAGHAFQGWWTQNGYGGNWGTAFTASTPVTADITVYAKWNPPPDYYTVTFNKNNSDPGSTEASPNSLGVAAGNIVNPLPTQPARTGYTFVGWNTIADGSGTAFTASTPVTANITVYAQWIDTPLILVINGSSGTFTIPINDDWDYDWTIDWGDGIVETKTGTAYSGVPEISHTYTANPQYTIEITANSNTGHAAFGFYNTTPGASAPANKQKLLKALGHIKENTSVPNIGEAWRACFYQCTNLNEVSPDLLPNVDNGGGSIFLSMFKGCTGLTSLPAGFRLPAVPNGSGSIFNEMFSGCTGLTSLPAGFQLPAVPNGTYGIFREMFRGCTGLTSLPAGFQLPAVLPNGTGDIFRAMFANCTGLSSLPVGFQLPDVPNGTYGIFYQMFAVCTGLTSLPAGFQLPAVPNGTESIFLMMFTDCSNLISLPAGFQLPDVPNGTRDIFYRMFEGCTGLTSLPAGFKLPAVPNGTSNIFLSMFTGCTGLTSLPAGFQLPSVPNGTSGIFQQMFSGCTGLSSLPAGFQLPSVPSGTNDIFSSMFFNCSALSTNIENLIGPNIFSPGQENYTYFMRRTFGGCSSLTGSASNALSMGFYGNTSTTPPTPTVDLDTFRSCPAPVTAGLHANWQ
ncbi:hypothetical protein FACS189476_00420 [Spirochaetia bacterium]|nr:hypothetical protein FACS189476_00420 [Spirochaetia bacterium]